MSTVPRRNRAGITRLPPAIWAIVKLEASKWAVLPSDLLSGSRTQFIVRARHAVIQKLQANGHSQTQIARWLGMHPSSVCYYEHRRRAISSLPSPYEIPCPDLSGEWAI